MNKEHQIGSKGLKFIGSSVQSRIFKQPPTIKAGARLVVSYSWRRSRLHL